jgi:hypothetical protein
MSNLRAVLPLTLLALGTSSAFAQSLDCKVADAVARVLYTQLRDATVAKNWDLARRKFDALAQINEVVQSPCDSVRKATMTSAETVKTIPPAPPPPPPSCPTPKLEIRGQVSMSGKTIDKDGVVGAATVKIGDVTYHRKDANPISATEQNKLESWLARPANAASTPARIDGRPINEKSLKDFAEMRRSLEQLR